MAKSVLVSPSAHSIPCDCPPTLIWKTYDHTLNSFQAQDKFYLWIYLPCGNGFTMPFPTLEEAYASGEKYVFEHNTIPLQECEFDEDASVQWITAEGKAMCSPDMYWNFTLCQIKKDVRNKTIPANKQWCYLVTPRHQMIIGLGMPSEA